MPYHSKTIHLYKALQGFQKWHYLCDRGKSENMITDQNVKFDENLFLISRRFSPWSFSVKQGCEPQQTCIYGSWLEEHKSDFKLYVGYSMMKICHLEVTYLFKQNFNF